MDYKKYAQIISIICELTGKSYHNIYHDIYNLSVKTRYGAVTTAYKVYEHVSKGLSYEEAIKSVERSF